MNFRIADSFTDALGRLTGDEQKAVKTTAFDLQVDPSRPGHSFHRLDRARDKSFWSVRVSRDIRIIVHRTSHSLLLCYVDHHDRAYDWAERRKLERHPTTGAAQIVEIRETVKEIVVPSYVEAEQPPAPPPAILKDRSKEELLQYGVPEEWVDDVRAADEDMLLAVAERLPAEAAEAVLELAVGGSPAVPEARTGDPFEHPDAQRRFRVLENADELEQALSYPWDRWLVFLHPAQREWVEKDFNGPARVSGSAGTGKTIVALHRAAHLARANEGARVLLATFSDALSNALSTRLRKLLSSTPRVAERIDVASLDALALRLHRRLIGPVELATPDDLDTALGHASTAIDTGPFSARFLADEWRQVVDAWQVADFDVYRSISRLGRRARLAESHRETIWPVFAQVRETLRDAGRRTLSEVYTALAEALEAGARSPYDFAVVDEAQDLSVAQLRFFAALGADRPNGLFFAGDLGQRIFQAPFSWSELGVGVRGRAKVLKVNYRTSHQIRSHADRLLDPELGDLDGNREDRRGTVSVFNGPPPELHLAEDIESETETVAAQLAKWADEGIVPEQMGVFVRSETELDRARTAVTQAGLDVGMLDERMAASSGRVAVGTMHRAKGLEFAAVAVMACDESVVPLQSRIESVGDEAHLKEVYDTERHLLYVACTRARERLLVSGVEPGSEFLEDMGG